jgi:hypothetical protein
MSTAVLDPCARSEPAPGPSSPPRVGEAALALAGAAAVVPSLDVWMTALWGELECGRRTACPACGDVIGAAARRELGVLEVRCERCGSTLC